VWHTFGTSSYTDELCSIALRPPGRVEGYFERLSPMLRQGAVRRRTAVAALAVRTASSSTSTAFSPVRAPTEVRVTMSGSV
jgi:hypothetical protein